MKYKNYMSVLLFTGVIGLQSCESFLDTYPKESDRRRGRCRRPPGPPRDRRGAPGLRLGGGRRRADGGADQQPVQLAAGPHAGHGVRRVHLRLPGGAA